MKLYTPMTPPETFRLTFRKQGFKMTYLILEESTIEEIEVFLKTLIPNLITIDPFYIGDRIGIDIREYRGKEVGKSKTVSFKHQISPEELKHLLLNYFK